MWNDFSHGFTVGYSRPLLRSFERILKPCTKSKARIWQTLAPDFGGKSGGMGAGNSGDKSHAVQTLRVGRAAPNFAPAFGLRVLEHRFVPHGSEVTSWNDGHFHFGIRD